MTTVDKVFKNGKIVTPAGMFEGGIAVEAGRIVAVASNATLPNADVVVDLDGKIVLPGIVDNHVHFGSRKGDPEREDFESGTKAAASGGITTISDMPTGVPGVLNTWRRRRDTLTDAPTSTSPSTAGPDARIGMHSRGWPTAA